MICHLPRFSPVCRRLVELASALLFTMIVGTDRASAQDKNADPAARLHAVRVLADNVWQADPRCEEALVHALRGDASESVRIQAAAAFTKAKYLTPKSFNALQHCVVGSSGDGFPGERTPSVKAAAQQALKKHPTSASPAVIARLQETTARARGQSPAGPTLGNPADVAAVSQPASPSATVMKPAAAPGELRFRSVNDGSEESSLLPRLGRPVPADVPCPCNAAPSPATYPMTAPAPATTGRIVPHSVPIATEPEEPAARSWFSIFKKREAPPAPKPNIITKFADAPSNPVSPANANTREDRPRASPIPTTDRTPPEEKASSLPSIDGLPEENVTLRQRRADLRESGLRDNSLRVFTSHAGAGPPPQTAPASGGLFRRWFAPATPAAPVETGAPFAPLAAGSTLRTP